jgi:hypothetical protein
VLTQYSIFRSKCSRAVQVHPLTASYFPTSTIERPIGGETLGRIRSCNSYYTNIEKIMHPSPPWNGLLHFHPRNRRTRDHQFQPRERTIVLSMQNLSKGYRISRLFSKRFFGLAKSYIRTCTSTPQRSMEHTITSTKAVRKQVGG